MRFHHRLCVAGLFAVVVCSVAPRSGRAESPPSATPEQGRKAIARGLDFLQKDAVQWKKDRNCATCHHGVMTVFSLTEAKLHGYEVNTEIYAEMVKWTKERHLDREKLDAPRDPRPGYNMMNTAGLNLALMALCAPKQEAVSAEELQKLAGHLVRHQEADGSWSWNEAPPKNRAPPFFESDEVATLLAYLALGPQVPIDSKEKSDIRDARIKAAFWLTQTKPTETTQSTALWLLLDVQAGEPMTVQAAIQQLLARQNKDGGWGQIPDAASDAYATGQALYMLSIAGVKNDRDEVRRGVTFLVSTQKEDGSWPMNRRSHAGVTPSNNVVPINYFGSAWATLGLIRSVAK